MPRIKKARINKNRLINDIKPKTRNFVECKCTLHCNGSRSVDSRTQTRHE